MKQTIQPSQRGAIATEFIIMNTMITHSQDEKEADTCDVIIRLLGDDGECVDQFTVRLTDEQYDSWGSDNNVLKEFVAKNLNLTAA